MSFLPVKSDTGAATPWEYLAAAAGTYTVGQLLNVTGGKLAAITAASTTTPPYVCMADTTVADGELIPVVRVSEGNIFETTLSAAAADAAVGDKLQVSKGGLEADAAAAGTFELVELPDGTTAKGDTVRGRWTAPAPAASKQGS